MDNAVGGASPRRWTILFLSRRGSARSVIAAAIAARVGAGRLRGLAAAVQPDPAPDPLAIQLLRNHQHAVEEVPSPRHYAALVQDPSALPIHFVFTLSDTAAGEAPPEWPGQPVTAHWACPDPVVVAARQEVAAGRALAYAHAYAVLDRRLRIFAALPFGQLDRMALQAEVVAIGRSA